MLLTVEYNAGEQAVEIHIDREGVDLLVERLSKLKEHSGQEHDHLMTESWGGSELTEEKQGAENELINHLRITFWPD